MKLILHLIILAALTNFDSISALKCYSCTEKGFDDFCSSTQNSDSWQIIDCDGSCAEQIQLYHRFSRPSKRACGIKWHQEHFGIIQSSMKPFF